MAVISGIGHVGLQVRDLDANLDHARRFLGLRQVEEVDGWHHLTHGSPHHSIQYRHGDMDAVDHIGLEAPDGDALEQLRRRLEQEGVKLLSSAPLDPMLADGFAFVGPEGFVFEVYTGMQRDQPETYPTEGVRPARFGHVNLACSDTQGMADFLQRVLDFRVSDNAGPVWFLRCNVDHHGIALLPAERARLHHHAWEVPGLVELQNLADRLDQEGESIIWGPVRHGMGRNVAVYIREPAGTVIEYYCDMDRIYDEASYVLKEWDMSGHKWYSLWAPALPEGFLEMGVDTAAPR